MTKKRAYLIIFVLILCFIWGNSMLNSEISGAISHFVANIFGGEQGATDEEHYFLRKLAHFTEFALLGADACLLFDSFTSDKYKKISSVAFVGVFVPLMDETIQMFSERGPALTDVWIDISGYIFGCAIVFLVFFYVKKLKNNRKRPD